MDDLKNKELKEAGETTPTEAVSAWQAAAEEGVDMSLIEESLRKTPEERVREHGYALATLEMLRREGVGNA